MKRIIEITPAIALSILACVSLFLISTLDRGIYHWLDGHAASLSIIADLRLTSLATILGIYFCTKRYFPTEDRKGTAEEIKRALLLAVIWILATAYFVLIRKTWVPALNRWIDTFAFMITGLLGEELLFRGALYDLSVKTFGLKNFARFSVPVWITSILFGVQHLGYHHFQINSASITQIIYTTVMGLFFCNLREASGRLWPVVLLHLLTNSFTLIRNLNFF
jgi:membrane protease YdiL (CAAX protease family)